MKTLYEVIPLKIGLPDIKYQLEEMAEKGWELITIVHQPSANKGSAYSGHLAYFKKIEA